MTSTIERINYLLKDTSMPSMILLDGSWGSGKTYFIKNKLIPYFKNRDKKVVFFSLYGVSDLNDFRSKLLSVYVADHKDASTLADSAKGILVALGNALGEGASGSVGAAIGGMAGMAQHALLSKIKDFTLILDDLERVSDKKLIKQILGECIELAENNNITVIIASNASKIVDKNDREKAFIDTVTYSTTPERMVEIAVEHSKSEHIKNNQKTILSEVKRLNFTNLRILKRAIFRLNVALEFIKGSGDIDKEASVEIVTSVVISTCFAHYEAKLRTRVIKDNLSHENRLHEIVKEQKNRTELAEETKTARKIFNHQYSINDEAVDFCIRNTPEIDFVEAFCLPKKSDPLSSLINYNYQHMSEHEFIEAENILELFIKSRERENYAKWLKACDVALYLSKYRYIDWPRSQILSISRETLLEKAFAPISDRGLRLRINDPELQKIHEDNFDIVKEKSQKEKVNAFTERMKYSWLSVEDEAKQQSKNLFFLEFTSGGLFKDCIMNWDVRNINVFEQYICERVDGIELIYLSNLKEIVEMLDEYIENEDKKLKRGALSELFETLKHACEKVVH